MNIARTWRLHTEFSRWIPFTGWYSVDDGHCVQWPASLWQPPKDVLSSWRRTPVRSQIEPKENRKNWERIEKETFFESLRWQLTERHENRKLQNKLLCWKNWLRLLSWFYSVDSTGSPIESNKERPIERLIEWLIESNGGAPATAVSYGFWTNRPGCFIAVCDRCTGTHGEFGQWIANAVVGIWF